MKYIIAFIILAVIGGNPTNCGSEYAYSYHEPEQIHIAFGGKYILEFYDHFQNPSFVTTCHNFCSLSILYTLLTEKINDIVVTWTTINDTLESLVNFGVFPELDQVAVGIRTNYKDLRGQWIHRATLKNLQFDTIYSKRLLKYLLYCRKIKTTYGAIYRSLTTFDCDNL